MLHEHCVFFNLPDNNIRTRKMLECEAVRRDNANSGVTGFWGGVLMGARENLACD